MKFDKLTIKTPERRHRPHSGVSIVTVKQVWHIFLIYQLLTLNRQIPTGTSLIERIIFF